MQKKNHLYNLFISLVHNQEHLIISLGTLEKDGIDISHF